MPDYKKGKLYKIQCDDGYYYIGSTCDELRKRLWCHKTLSRNRNSRLYQHIKEIGWNHVRIILIEDYPCDNKQQLLRREDELINRNDVMCLNMIGSVLDVENKTLKSRERALNYYHANREEIRIKKKEEYYKKTNDPFTDRQDTE